MLDARAVALVALAALVAGLAYVSLALPPPALAPEAVEKLVQRTLQESVVPTPAARAYAAVSRSVVRVERQGAPDAEEGELVTEGIGTGVVVSENGVILTSLHVVDGAAHVRLVFAGGEESSARVVSREPRQDLAVLQAETVPPGLVPATLGSAQGLRPGDDVVAVGFPFGIGPSVSSGVISGLERSWTSRDGEHVLEDLIQFDAAANPGNSGGPLVSARGEVIGVVTAIINPSGERAFVGIAFAVPIQSAARSAGLPPV